MKKIPILVLAFNRADHVSEAMKAIREYQPEKLYLECDGPRLEKKGEDEKVNATRKAMLVAVDWPCEVKTLFREQNMGCAHAVNDAITWFFNHEEFGVIVEDDIVISQDFFKLCENLLPRYLHEDRIMAISAQNRKGRTNVLNSYVYSYRHNCWGWASWKRAWQKMDMTMSAAPKLSRWFLIKRLGLFEGVMMKYYFMAGYREIDTLSSWATRWYLSILANNGLVIVPGVNLAVNIGTDGGAHYQKDDKNPYENLKIEKLTWPIEYNDSLVVDKKQSNYDANDFWNVRMIGLRKKVKKYLHI